MFADRIFSRIDSLIARSTRLMAIGFVRSEVDALLLAILGGASNAFL